MNLLKKNIIRGLIACMVIATTAGVVFAVNNFETWYTSANNGLNCRQTPSTAQDNILKTYPKGTELQIIGIDETGKWWETWDGETQGWCHSSYFVHTKEELESQTTTSSSGEHGAYLGNFRITGYTASPSENGGSSVDCFGKALSPQIGQIIAVDPNVIPLGTRVYIDGIGYRTARDTGGAIKGNKIDVLTSSNSESMAITGYYNVYLAQ